MDKVLKSDNLIICLIWCHHRDKYKFTIPIEKSLFACWCGLVRWHPLSRQSKWTLESRNPRSYFSNNPGSYFSRNSHSYFSSKCKWETRKRVPRTKLICKSSWFTFEFSLSPIVSYCNHANATTSSLQLVSTPDGTYWLHLLVLSLYLHHLNLKQPGPIDWTPGNSLQVENHWIRPMNNICL